VSPIFGRLRSRLQLALALGCLIAAECFAGVPLDTVRDCAATASPALYGLKALSTACPDLEAALGSLNLDKFLYDGWREKLSVHALSDAIDLAGRYSQSRWHGAPDISAVPGIVQTLKDEQAPRRVSWWLSLKGWIKQWLQHSDSSIAKWIKHLLQGVLGTSNVTPGVLRAFVYGVTILAALAAVIVILRELEAAGFLARFRRPRIALSAAKDPLSHASQDDGPAADANAPSAILRALVMRLLQMGRLTRERNLTHRELIARTSFDNNAQQIAFAGVAGLAETLLYGSQAANPEIVERVSQQGRELLQQLCATPGPT
jgi:hypothetical protein